MSDREDFYTPLNAEDAPLRDYIKTWLPPEAARDLRQQVNQVVELSMENGDRWDPVTGEPADNESWLQLDIAAAARDARWLAASLGAIGKLAAESVMSEEELSAALAAAGQVEAVEGVAAALERAAGGEGEEAGDREAAPEICHGRHPARLDLVLPMLGWISLMIKNAEEALEQVASAIVPIPAGTKAPKWRRDVNGRQTRLVDTSTRVPPTCCPTPRTTSAGEPSTCRSPT